MSELRVRIASLLAAGTSQSEIARRLGVAHATVGYHARLLSQPQVTHVEAEPPASARSQVRTRELVAELLAGGVTKLEIARRLGIGKATVSYHARRLGAPVDARCARRYDWAAIQRYYDAGHSVDACQRAFGFARQTWHAAKNRGDIKTRPHRMPIEQLCVAGAPRNRRHVRQRLVAAGLKEERCEECGLTEWHGRPAPLALHHVNGDRHDNRFLI